MPDWERKPQIEIHMCTGSIVLFYLRFFPDKALANQLHVCVVVLYSQYFCCFLTVCACTNQTRKRLYEYLKYGDTFKTQTTDTVVPMVSLCVPRLWDVCKMQIWIDWRLAWADCIIQYYLFIINERGERNAVPKYWRDDVLLKSSIVLDKSFPESVGHSDYFICTSFGKIGLSDIYLYNSGFVFRIATAWISSNFATVFSIMLFSIYRHIINIISLVA